MVVNVGVDLHKTCFTVFVKHEKQQFAEYRTNEQGYKRFTNRISAWKEAGLQVRVGVESTGNTRFFKNTTEKAGAEVIVINTLKFKVVTESVKKTDRHDAATIAEFLEKDMLPEAKLCSEKSEQLRRLLKVRSTLICTIVTVKNQIHALLTGLGMEDTKASLQSKRGRQKILDVLEKAGNGLVVQPLFNTIEQLYESVKSIEAELAKLTQEDKTVQLLMSIPGCGPIIACTIRAYTDDIKRFASAKKYAAYAGLVPCVRNSNMTVHYGKITKHGPEGLRTAFVQLVMGIRRCTYTANWRIIERYEYMKQHKGSGKSIIATARKLATIVWYMLSSETPFDNTFMIDKILNKKAFLMQTLLTNY